MTGEVCHKLKISLVVAGLFWSVQTQAIEESMNIVSGLQDCRNLKTSEEQRLKCFDDLAKRYAPPTYKGKLGKVTDNFVLNESHILRYRSHGVIFVLYLRDEKGNVLQNLHIGGRGEDEYLIKEPGEYSLKIDGSASWEIWLEPLDS